MICKYCGKNIPDDSEICPRCFAEVKEKVPEEKTEEKEEK